MPQNITEIEIEGFYRGHFLNVNQHLISQLVQKLKRVAKFSWYMS